MKKKRNFILAATSLAIAGFVIAVNHGRYFCDNCTNSLPSPQDILVFVRSTVNHDVNIWRVGDAFDLCNGTMCTRLINSRADASVFAVELVYPDPKVGYKRSGSLVGSGGFYYPPGGTIPVTFPPGGWDPGGVVIVGPICPSDTDCI
jgi:hypothetical protein